jgi:hypothetical protein
MSVFENIVWRSSTKCRMISLIETSTELQTLGQWGRSAVVRLSAAAYRRWLNL